MIEFLPQGKLQRLLLRKHTTTKLSDVVISSSIQAYLLVVAQKSQQNFTYLGKESDTKTQARQIAERQQMGVGNTMFPLN